MKHFQRIRIFIFVFLCSTVILAQSTPLERGLNAISKDAVQAQLEFLASDWTEGREATTRGEFIAADYIASIFKLYGIKPAGDSEMQGGRNRGFFPGGGRGQQPPMQKTYFQNINFIESEVSDDQVFGFIQKEGEAKKKITFNYRSDFTLNPGSVGVEFEAPIVFVGYGFRDLDKGYDDYKDVNVRGKLVLRISGFPGMRDTGSVAYKKLNLADRTALMNYYRLRNEIPEKLGAVGVIDFMPGADMLQNAATNYPIRFNTAFYEGDKRLSSGSHRISLPEDTLRAGLTQITIGARVANEIFKGTGIIIEEFEKQVAQNFKPASKELKGKAAFIKTSIKTKVVRGRNVVGMIEGENPNEVIVVGGHYDHVGTSNGYIWNGADDNASGTVGVMSIAKAVAATGVKPKRTIIFACWTGEEKGLLGSEYFVEKYKPINNIILNLNYDMIGRNDESDSKGVKLGVSYTEAYPILKDMFDKANKDLNLGLEIRFSAAKRPTGGSDYASFSAKDIPVYGVMAAMHPDYHQPTDHVDKINYEKMTNIIKLGFASIWDFATAEKKLEPVK